MTEGLVFRLYCLPLLLFIGASGLPTYLVWLFGGLYLLLAPVFVSTVMEVFN